MKTRNVQEQDFSVYQIIPNIQSSEIESKDNQTVFRLWAMSQIYVEFEGEVFNSLILIHVNLIHFAYSVHVVTLLIELPLYFDLVQKIALGYLAFNCSC